MNKTEQQEIIVRINDLRQERQDLIDLLHGEGASLFGGLRADTEKERETVQESIADIESEMFGLAWDLSHDMHEIAEICQF